MFIKMVRDSPLLSLPPNPIGGPMWGRAGLASVQGTLDPKVPLPPGTWQCQAHAGHHTHLFSPLLGNLSLVVHVTLVPKDHLFDICRGVRGRGGAGVGGKGRGKADWTVGPLPTRAQGQSSVTRTARHTLNTGQAGAQRG